MLVNSNTFNIQSTITDNWGGSYRIVLDLEALSIAQDWKLEISLPQDYKIDQIYDGELTHGAGQTYISGKGWNESLAQGTNTEIVLIVHKGDSNQASITPEFIFADSINSASINSELDTNSLIVEDWYGGYKLEVAITSESQANGWQLDFNLPYEISEVYGVDLINHGNGKYSIDGKNDQVNLLPGQQIKPIFIIQDGGNNAVLPEFIINNSQEIVQEVIPTNETPEFDNNIVAEPNTNENIINVEKDFGGNLASAIAEAEDGDIVLLGQKIYYTNGLTISKDITIEGQSGSVINGGGTSEPIISLTSGATGATIQNIEITNGNVGIYGYSVFDLTLDNLEINNIGLSQTMRDGQNNTGIVLNRADGLQLMNSYIHDVGRKGIGVNDTDGALISDITVENVNLAAQHSQSFDAAGIKFFNTNEIIVRDGSFSDNNAINIWNDTTNATTIQGNVITNVGEYFLAPDFDSNVNITGIYNEKSSNSIIKNNEATAVGEFLAFNATEFSTETMTLIDNNFSSFAVNTQDYWVNEEVEKLIATTEDPDAADFSLFADEYFAQANIG